ncbi:hypothetical protein SUNI508_13945 [Seiridium unicorne]|uniref:Elongation of fatty acids protein n=1 Tax=Seiridium unicorne TaxID=138068 RepID=A0ABR2VAA1_9PEZI
MASSSSVYFDAPSASLFKFPPPSEPEAIPPSYIDVPFTIPDSLFTTALDPKAAITIASTYAITVGLLNSYNKSTGKKPWVISQTAPFRIFIIFHDIFLAIFSVWIFIGMLGALRRSIISPTNTYGLAGTVDSFCKLNGPSGLGNAASYNQEQNKWEISPNRDDTGRLWNEGLAFYGWIFYLSKFYATLDTFIVLAKGKLSSTLQTYYHAGAILYLWVGIRYMSAPIWIFVVLNSLVQARTYTYYAVTAFKIHVSTNTKRTLTIIQIIQCLICVCYAVLHPFVHYTIPVPVAASLYASVVSSAATAATESNVPGSLLDSLQETCFGAANSSDILFSQETSTDSVAYEMLFEPSPCVTTTGQIFAVWLNVLYLAPMTYLFANFYYTNHIRRTVLRGRLAPPTAARMAP